MSSPLEATPNPSDSSIGTHLADLATLDSDLRDRLGRVAAEQAAHDERFLGSQRVLAECALWLLAGAAVWVLTIAVWR